MFGRITKLAILACSALAVPAVASAQSPVAGTYEWDVDFMIRRGGGGGDMPTAGDKARARLVVNVKGDSAFGTYAITPPAGAEVNVPVREFKGTLAGNKLNFIMTGEARVNINGDSQPVQMKSTYNLTVEGDEIKGTIDTEAAGMPMQVPQRLVAGKRVKE